MANSAISSAAERLSTLIRNELGLELGVDKEMRELSGVISFINAVVDDAGQLPPEDPFLRNWLPRITDVANTVSNILDECQTQALRHRHSSGCLNKVLTCYPVVKLMFRRKIAIKINHIIREINHIIWEVNAIVQEAGLFPPRNIEKEDLGRSIQTSCYASREDVFGREEDIEKISKVLTVDLCNLEELSVYPIIGMGGLGKTTLAQLIFNDDRIAYHFWLRIWICVSQDFDIKTVMKQIIMHDRTSDTIPEASSLDWLANRIRKMLSRERYLLVLDDMLCKDVGEWDKLKNALACGRPGCCVIVTTRDDKTATMVRTLPAHHLSPQSQDDCWLVLRRQAFGYGREHKECPELVEIGKEIVKMCGGVPLAAIALGKELRYDGRKETWHRLKDRVHKNGARPFAEEYGRCKIEEWVNVKESDLPKFVEGECSTLDDLTCHASSSNNPEIQHTDDNKVHMDQVLDDNDVILNLSHLLGVELGYVERSFEDAKNAMDRVFAQMKEARIKFNDLLIMQKQQQLETTRGGGESKSKGDSVLLVSLQELKTKVSNMKSKIPFSLILPSKSEQLTSNPHFNWIPRNRPHRRRLEAPPPPPPPHPVPTFEHFQKLEWPEKLYLRCLAAFPEGAIIKKSLLVGLLESCTSELDKAEEIVDTFVTNGLMKPLYKKCNLTVCGYWVHPLIRCTVRDKLIWSPEDYIYIADNIDEEDVIYDDPIKFPDHTTLSVLHFGIWQKSSSYHVEVTEPDVFFKDVPKSAELRYLSLRGISMIKELPKCITELRCLRKLDLKACHNLEVIPTEIASLKESLTCLDMSECYFLDHMPMALSQLHKLTVLKGFFVGKTNRVETCTLKDLVGLRGLVKLSIYTNDQGFPNESELATLHDFKALRKLTISWGGCLSKAKAGSTSEANTHLVLEGSLIDKKFDFKLEKLDLQCIPTTTMYSWLRPCNFKTLEKLYIRGGQLQDICHKRQDKNNKRSSFAEEDQWKVEVLCLKYLKLKMDLHEVEMLFPRLIYLEKVECPNLMYFPTDDIAVQVDDMIEQLAWMILKSKHLVAFTGAGISTSCGIPDFRGPKGVWTLQREGKAVPEASLPFDRAMPSITHMALAELEKAGILKFVISQNIDSLHLRSGIPREKLSELHGNSFREVCPKCGLEYLRDFEVETIGMKETSRRCADMNCGAKLKDSVLDWEDVLPSKEIDAAEEHCRMADIVLCLGTSLQITPACNLPLKCLRGGGKVVIVNLQQTPKDKKAGLVIHGLVDKVIAGVIKHLNLRIPPFVRVDLFQIIFNQCCGSPERKYAKWSLRVKSVHGDKAPLPFIESVEISFPARADIKPALLDRQPFVLKRETVKSRPLKVVVTLNFSDGCWCQTTSINFPVNFQKLRDSVAKDEKVVMQKIRDLAIQDERCGQLAVVERKTPPYPKNETTTYAIATNIVWYGGGGSSKSSDGNARSKYNKLVGSPEEVPMKKLRVH